MSLSTPFHLQQLTDAHGWRECHQGTESTHPPTPHPLCGHGPYIEQDIVYFIYVILLTPLQHKGCTELHSNAVCVTDRLHMHTHICT